VGQLAQVRVRITRNDGHTVSLDDLLVMHTQKIHLLIIDQSLCDYHHKHPKPTSLPGEYAFSFTPQRPGPYRIFADVVPASTSMQEYLITDIATDTAPQAIGDRATVLIGHANELTFELTLYPPGQALREGVAVMGRINIKNPDGSPFTGLEPVMGAFAHIVGFCEDHKTVVHIHPMGADPLRPADRGGPTLQFMFYPPAAGYMKLYCQVSIEGKMQFVPFAVTVIPKK
jgi:hypothetical protein